MPGGHMMSQDGVKIHKNYFSLIEYHIKSSIKFNTKGVESIFTLQFFHLFT